MKDNLICAIRLIAILMFLLFVLFLIGFFWSEPANAETTEESADIQRAIEWLATVQYEAEQKSLGVKWGPHPILKNRDFIDEISEAVIDASSKRYVNPYLILLVIWRESRFEQKVYDLQKRGMVKQEAGLMQVHGMAAVGCDLKTVAGQIDCGTKWLKKCLDLCDNSEIGALTFYAGGSRCKALKNSALERSMINRYNLFQKLQSLE